MRESDIDYHTCTVCYYIKDECIETNPLLQYFRFRVTEHVDFGRKSALRVNNCSDLLSLTTVAIDSCPVNSRK